jgi:hypothetical protein
MNISSFQSVCHACPLCFLDPKIVIRRVFAILGHLFLLYRFRQPNNNSLFICSKSKKNKRKNLNERKCYV